MKAYESMLEKGHEQIVICQDKDIGLEAIIAIHSTVLGPSLGGCRIWHYQGNEDGLTPFEAAMNDALRLSEGMTYKASAAGLDLGGGKAVIICDPTKLEKKEREAIFRKFGEFVNSLSGKYITAEDVGTSVADMHIIREKTKYVTGISKRSGGSGDPSPLTAYGVYWGMKACAKEMFGITSLMGKTIAIQGLGHVGYSLARHLHKEGAKLIVEDVKAELAKKATKEFGAAAVQPGKIYSQQCDIFAPCALGAILNDKTIEKLKCKIIAGAANNQLKNPGKHGKALQSIGILYAPDYVINAGGLINVAMEETVSGKKYSKAEAKKAAKKIYDRIEEVIRLSKDNKLSTYEAASKIAKKRIEEAKENR